jgi:hypothetical protein
MICPFSHLSEAPYLELEPQRSATGSPGGVPLSQASWPVVGRLDGSAWSPPWKVQWRCRVAVGGNAKWPCPADSVRGPPLVEPRVVLLHA